MGVVKIIMDDYIQPHHLIYRSGSVGLEETGKREVVIQWLITRNCNYNCSYCGNWNKQHSPYLSKTDAFKIVDYLHEIKCDTMTIIFLGGEPLLYPYLEEVIQYTHSVFKDREYTVCLFTNMYASYDKLRSSIDCLRKERDVFLATYHPSKCCHTVFKDRIWFVHEFGDIQYKVNIMMEKNEQENVLKMMEFTKPLIGKKRNLGFECVHALGSTSHKEQEEYRKLTEEFNSLTKEDPKMDVFYDVYDIKTKQSTRYIFNQGLLKLIDEKFITFKKYLCFRYSHLCIDEDGTVSPRCDEYEKKKEILGNILDEQEPLSVSSLNMLIRNEFGCPNKTCQRCDMLCIPKRKLTELPTPKIIKVMNHV